MSTTTWKLRAKALAFSIVALGVLGGAQGCAGERDPINRVQPNALSKSLFVRADADGRWLSDSDSWYFRATITDVPASQSTAFIGAAGEMYRVKWRIEENFLVAYREDPDILNSGDPNGGRVAAFPITSHFDIRRQYNANTGEEGNVVEENTTDRAWDQREWMRVDWSNNQISRSMFVAPGFESVSAVTNFVQDPKSADAPLFQDGYVDVTARYTVSPDIYSCYYYYRDVGCGPGDISARLSFMKVPERDFVPREYPDRITLTDEGGNPLRNVSGSVVSLPMMDQFGFFRTERAQYDQRYGSLEKRFLYRANTWNLWDQWFRRDDKGQVVKTESGENAVLPYSERKVRPIVYHVNGEWPADLKKTAMETADAWNDAFSETVAALRLLEKKAPGEALTNAELRAEVQAMRTRDVGYGKNWAGDPWGERVYVLCSNNPVAPGDHPLCGKPGDRPRQGDLRYSFMYWVPKPQPSGPLGFGPSYPDPITGQIFTASAYIYGAALDTYAQQATDIVNLLNGRWTEFDLANGIAADEYAKRLARGEVPAPTESGVAGFDAMTPGKPGFQLPKAQAQVERAINRPLLATIAKQGAPLATGATGKQRLEQVFQNPALAQKILENPETRLLAGFDPTQSIEEQLRARSKGADVSDAKTKALKQISDVMLEPDMVKKENERLRFLGEHGCYLDAAMVDDSTIGLARELARKYAGAFQAGGPAAEQERLQKQVWQELREHILRGVLEHEVGHTVGLRHNFEGSSDAINFHDRFWDLKSETLQFGAPMTERQKNERMTEYQYSTVMDYGSRFNSDIHSLGKYDYAAIRFGYGDLVETFPKGAIKDKLYNARPDQFGSGFFTGYSAEVLDDVNRQYRHYTQIPAEMDTGVERIKASGREIRPFAEIVANATNLYAKARGNTTLVKTTSSAGGIDVVPYRYCGDEFAGSASRPLCQRWDQGADAAEVVVDAMSRYRDYYIFDAFTRGKVSGANTLRGYLSKIVSRYFSHVHSQYIHWLFYQGSNDYYWSQIFGGQKGVDAGYITNADWFKDPAGGLPATIATTWGLDRLIDVLATPDVGVYVPNQDSALQKDNAFWEQATSSPYACQNAAGGADRCASSKDLLALDIDQGARYRYTRYDTATGQGYFNRIKNVGSFYDKIAALLMLTNTETNFVGQDQTNAVSYRIGFYLAFPKAMSSIFGGIATDAFDNYAWRYEWEGLGQTGNVKLYTPNVFQALGGEDQATAATGASAPALKGKPVDSGWFFYYKAYSLFFSMAEFQSNFSQSWNDAVRVWCVGCGEAFTPGAGTTPVTFTDPLSGKQYGALEYGDGRYSPGAGFVKQGQQLVTAFDEAKAKDPASANYQYYVNRARARLQDHVELLDLVRGLYQVYGYTRF